MPSTDDVDQPYYDAPPGVAWRRYWQRYVVFSGRAGRAEYWWPVLFNGLIATALGIIASVLVAVGAGLRSGGTAASVLPLGLGLIVLLLVLLFALATIVPSLSVAVRRLHDADLSGLFVLLGLIPSVGGLILVILHVLPPNPAGRRFDRRPVWTPSAVEPPRAVRMPQPAFDAWPAPADPAPPTAPVPALQAEEPVDDAMRAAWAGLGAVTEVAAPLGLPALRRLRWLVVDRSAAAPLLATDGLGSAEGAAALGAGAELFLAARSVDAAVSGSGRWEFETLSAVARRVGASGMHLPSELEQYGTLSMTVPAPDAPEAWRTPEGSLGVLVGLPVPGVPEAVATPGGEVRLVSVTPITPEELQQILDGGGTARGALAARLAAMPPEDLAARL